MPPKKRNRDVEVKPEPDPDQLDKDELKGMLRDSIDREANLTVQLENQKADLVAKMDQQKAVEDKNAELVQEKEELGATIEEQKKKIAEVEAKMAGQKNEIDQLFMQRIFLHFCPGTPNGELRRVFYPNCRVVQQAEAAGTTKRLDLASAVKFASMKDADSFVYYYPVETCTELVDIFENGLKAGAVLKEHQDDSSLFSLIIVTHCANAMTVPAGRENQYLVVAARSDVNRYNSLLAAYLDQDFMYQPRVKTIYDGLFHDEDSEYDQDIQDRVQRLEINEYSTVLKGVWVIDGPDADGTERAHRADLDFNRMVETAGSGKQVDMGFWVKQE